MGQIEDILETATGLQMGPAHRLARAAAVSRACPEGPEHLLGLLRSTTLRDDALARLIDEVTVKESYFLRDETQLATIDWASLLHHARSQGRDRVRIWSAGCATGEEAYTLAMLASEAFGTLDPPVDVLGTDISRGAIVAATTGLFRSRSVRLLSSDRRGRYFQLVDQGLMCVGDSLRQLVRFEEHNLTRDPFPPLGEVQFDLVLCRNVLIYFSDVVATEVLACLRRSIHSMGTVLLGSADALAPASQGRHWTPPVSTPGPDGASSSPSPASSRIVTAAVASTGEGQDRARAHAYFRAGLEGLDRTDVLGAMRSFRRALNADPHHVLAAFRLADTAEELGDREGARNAYEQALRALVRGATPGDDAGRRGIERVIRTRLDELLALD